MSGTVVVGHDQLACAGCEGMAGCMSGWMDGWMSGWNGIFQVLNFPLPSAKSLQSGQSSQPWMTGAASSGGSSSSGEKAPILPQPFLSLTVTLAGAGAGVTIPGAAVEAFWPSATWRRRTALMSSRLVQHRRALMLRGGETKLFTTRRGRKMIKNNQMHSPASLSMFEKCRFGYNFSRFISKAI